jgi:hypothetical protein
MNGHERRPSRLWAAAAQTVNGECGIYLSLGSDYIGIIAEANVLRAIADAKAYFGDDDFLPALLERAAADLPLLRREQLYASRN